MVEPPVDINIFMTLNSHKNSRRATDSGVAAALHLRPCVAFLSALLIESRFGHRMSNPDIQSGKMKGKQMKFLGPPSSGSIAGMTSSHNRAGQYTRSRRSPVQPVGTGRRAFIRSSFGNASKAWGALSSATQAAWATYAAAHAISDSLGQAVILTGHQMFVAVATEWQNVGQVMPPAVPVSAATVSPVVTVFTATAAGVITLTMTVSGGASDHILVAFSKPQGPGRTFCKTFWQQTVLPGNSIGAATYGAAYVAQFGTIPAGWKIFMQLTPVNQYGVKGVPTKAIALTT